MLDEKELIQKAVETNAKIAAQLERKDTENKRLWCAMLALLLCLGIMAGCMAYNTYNSQRATNAALIEAFQTVSEMETVGDTVTTTTQSVTGDSATINNVTGEQYTGTSEKAGDLA